MIDLGLHANVHIKLKANQKKDKKLIKNGQQTKIKFRLGIQHTITASKPAGKFHSEWYTYPQIDFFLKQIQALLKQYTEKARVHSAGELNVIFKRELNSRRDSSRNYGRPVRNCDSCNAQRTLH